MSVHAIPHAVRSETNYKVTAYIELQELSGFKALVRAFGTLVVHSCILHRSHALSPSTDIICISFSSLFIAARLFSLLSQLDVGPLNGSTLWLFYHHAWKSENLCSNIFLLLVLQFDQAHGSLHTNLINIEINI